MNEIKSLAMMKMEKNFIAHNEKGYPRQPYNIYSLADCFSFVEREMKELDLAVGQYYASRGTPKFSEESLVDILHEIADVSNCLDYLFEKTLIVVSKEKTTQDKHRKRSP